MERVELAIGLNVDVLVYGQPARSCARSCHDIACTSNGFLLHRLLISGIPTVINEEKNTRKVASSSSPPVFTQHRDSHGEETYESGLCHLQVRAADHNTYSLPEQKGCPYETKELDPLFPLLHADQLLQYALHDCLLRCWLFDELLVAFDEARGTDKLCLGPTFGPLLSHL